MDMEKNQMKQRITQQIKAYQLDLSQTDTDGAFHCPNCGAKISPDDHSEATYIIYETKLRDNDLEEVIIQCKRCLSIIHLSGFFKNKKQAQPITADEIAKQNTLLYIDHL